MDNFTPLNFADKKKKKKTNFFLIGNVVLLLIIAVITGYSFKNQLFSNLPKAYKSCGGCPAGSYCDTKTGSCTNSSGGTVASCVNGYKPDGRCRPEPPPQTTGSGYNQAFQNGNQANQAAGSSCSTPGATNGTQTCVNSGVGGVSGMHWTTCANGVVGSASCTPGTSGGNKNLASNNSVTSPTSTPTPQPTNTPTPTIVQNSPTPTPTTVANSPTPTATPAISSTPTATPLISNTPTLTPSPGPSSTPGPGPSATPIPVICGTKSCDNATNPCRSGYICIQANDGSNYCSSPDFVSACKINPSYNSCCIAPGAPTATPTEILIANVSPTAVTALLKTGTFSIIYLVPGLVILAGLLL